MTGMLIFLMIPAMVICLLNLGIGPFGHPSRVHLHQGFRRLPRHVRMPLLFISTLILIFCFTDVAGITHFTKPPEI